ncbi:MAG TPA: fructose-1,6-bisphosphate aldolase, partial [Alphaproteobacteria bacterium]|nr:fructose-1,6-bisphosphate aldolase [Alphaproteobacteria bacterium]
MPMITLRQLLDHAAEYGYGMPAFNVNNMEQILAVMAAAKKTDSPVIVQTSKGARGYAGDPMIRHMVEAACEMYPDIPVCLHQDHGSSVETCVTALANGYTSVMMDGSLKDGKPATHEYNAEVSGTTAKFAHMIGASVEAELGCIGSLET